MSYCRVLEGKNDEIPRFGCFYAPLSSAKPMVLRPPVAISLCFTSPKWPCPLLPAAGGRAPWEGFRESKLRLDAGF